MLCQALGERGPRPAVLVGDPNGPVAPATYMGTGGNRTKFPVADVVTGTGFGRVDLTRSRVRAPNASWVSPGGQAWLSTKRVLLRRKYAIRGAGGNEVGRVRHKFRVERDVWQLERNSGANHPFAAIVATILDFEK
jgi:hypothetical protein